MANMNDKIDIYPLSNYYFGSKDPVPSALHPFQHPNCDVTAQGLRTWVQAVLLVELHKHPHLLVLQEKTSILKLPGGHLRAGESEVDGLKRRLSRKLSPSEDSAGTEWQIGECLGKWWRSDFQTSFSPCLQPIVERPKECTKVFLVKLPESRKFIAPRNLKLIAVPLRQIHGNNKTYGPIISVVPQLLSKFSFNMIES